MKGESEKKVPEKRITDWEAGATYLAKENPKGKREA